MITKDLLFKDYLNHPALSRTFLHHISKKSLFEAKYLQSHPQEKKVFDFGSAVHKLVLEGQKAFDEAYAVGPEGIENKAKKDWREFAAGYKDSEFKLIKNSEWQSIKTIYDNVRKQCPKHIAEQLTENVGWSSEVSVFFEYQGVEIKIRPDKYFRGKRPTIIDLKTCQTANPWALQKHADDYGYHIQAYMYRLGVSTELGIDEQDVDFVFVFACSSVPHEVVTMIPTANFYDRGRECFQTAFDLHKEAVKTDNWPGYGNGKILDLNPPAYIMKQQDNQEQEDELF